jgi:hypothetical protein
LNTVHAPTSERGLGERPGEATEIDMLLQGARVRAKRKYKLKRRTAVLAALDQAGGVVVKLRVGGKVKTERWRA